MSHAVNGRGSKLGCALNKGFAYIKQGGRNSGFRSKVGGAALIRGVASNTGFMAVVLLRCFIH